MVTSTVTRTEISCRKAGKGDELFVVKEFLNRKNKHGGLQTRVTPKGRETFRLLYASIRRNV